MHSHWTEPDGKAMLDTIERNWNNLWAMNSNGPDAPNLSLEDIIPIFIANEIEFFEIDPSDRNGFLIFIGMAFAGVMRSGTHSKHAVRNAFQKIRQKNRKRFLDSTAYRAVIAGSGLWIAIVIIRTMFELEIAGIDFYRWSDSYFFLNLGLPPAVGLLMLWLYRWVRHNR